jgi:hypothetical protein
VLRMKQVTVTDMRLPFLLVVLFRKYPVRISTWVTRYCEVCRHFSWPFCVNTGQLIERGQHCPLQHPYQQTIHDYFLEVYSYGGVVTQRRDSIDQESNSGKQNKLL